MTDSGETQHNRIMGMAEAIEMLNLSDQNAWRDIAPGVNELIGSMEDVPHPVSVFFHAAPAAIAILGTDAEQDRFALVEALVDGFYTAAELVASPDGNADAITAASDALSRLVPQDTDEAADTAKIPSPTGNWFSQVNALAAALVLLEVTDTEELQSIGTGLAEIAGAMGDTPASELIGSALNAIGDLLTGEADSPDQTLAGAGSAIEKALVLMDETLIQDAEIPEKAAPSGDATAPETMADAGTDLPPVESAPMEQPEPEPVAAPPDEEPVGNEPQMNNTAMPAEESIPDNNDYMPDDADDEMLGEFIAESNDLIAEAEDALLSLENDPEDEDAVGKVFRAFHTVKGTAAFMELDLISEMGHHAESLLSRVRDKEIRYSGGYADISLRALDMIKDLVGAVQEALGGAPLLKPNGYDDLMTVLSDPEAAGVSAEQDEIDPPRLGDLLVAQGKADRDAVESAIANEEEDKPVGTKIVHAKAASVEEVGKAIRTQRKIRSGPSKVETSVRVGTNRLDRLIDMVGELVIAHSMVAQDDVVGHGANHELAKKVQLASKIVRELQDMSMSLRMVPLKASFNKMTRLVRDLGRKIGKKVELFTEGEDTEIDRNLVDIIGDPLVHMVRNAVDHGIEPPDVRVAAGKPELGRIKLAAYHSAGNVVVEIVDDGKGLDRDGILKKARERGLVTDGATPSDREIYNMIFEPGFSTAAVVTDVSGRGVGMDVVKKNIESLRGQVDIYSEPGRGSTFKMSLPLTLAIIDGMVVRVGKETYVIPTVSIIRSIKPEVEDMVSVMEKGKLLQLQGSLIPLCNLGEIYGLNGSSNGDSIGLVVVVEDDSQQAGFVIDELIGRQQVVIKSLGETMQDIPGIAGGAIMPNGRVGLILDVGGLIKVANSDSVGSEMMASDSF